jgi:transglutaminase-like putative cysteine protease
MPPERNAVRPVVHEIFHGANPSGQNVLIALQGVEWVEIAPLDAYDDGFVMLPAVDESSTGYQYRAASRPLVLADLPADTPVAVDSAVATEYLEIPGPGRVATFLVSQARGIVGETPTTASLIALETWLQNAFDYSLETTNPENLDPLENFLFSERRGHCEHFAMTGALMLRAVGIPARVTYGWAGGTWYEASRLMVFRSREAHAWTELWLPGHGWVVMDPTPPSGVHGTRSRIAPPEETPPDPVEEFTYEHEQVEAARVDHFAFALLTCSTLAAIAVVVWRRRRGDRSGSAAFDQAPDARTPGYLGAWAAACPPRYPGETLRQQLRRLEDPPHFARRLLDYHYHVQYRQTGPKPRFERALERDIRAWHRARESRNSLE